jgi:predicted DsbA family dithiol-disulfide isomerase
MKALDVDVWSDIACPWCYVGKRRLEAALARFPHPVHVVWHSFELDPAAPLDDGGGYAQRLAAKYRTSVERAQAMIDHMTRTAAAEGIEMRFDRVRATNTFDAHRLLHLAKHRDLGGAAKERLLRAYFTEGELISDRDTLARLGAEIGLDGDEVRGTLAGEEYAREVRADETTAQALGIRGVPFFVIDRRLGVSGAQPADVMLRVLSEALDAAPAVPQDEASVCGPDGCA